MATSGAFTILRHALPTPAPVITATPMVHKAISTPTLWTNSTPTVPLPNISIINGTGTKP